ncbi:MAG: hypothetical protein JXA69_14660 [Phycisphaerae bacterium]|nr:hypothetical protein [Phycisphaerae bacterium]
MMKTDIDRLHAVIVGQSQGRRCGKTVAVCHQIAGLLETVGPTRIGVVLSCLSDREYFASYLLAVLREHEMCCASSETGISVWRPMESDIDFISAGFTRWAGYEYLFDGRRHAHPAFPRMDAEIDALLVPGPLW